MVEEEAYAGEDIIYCYTSKVSPTEEEPTRAHVTYGETNVEKGKEVLDVNIFYSVKLTKSPRRQDYIIYNGKRFIVDKTRKSNKYSTMWDILVESNAKPAKERKDDF